MNIVLWILQILVGALFAFHGYSMGFRHHEMIKRPGMNWMGELPDWLRMLIGVCEVLGGIGLILPAALGILPWLVPLAGALLALVMLLALVYHVLRGEYRNLAINVILGVLAAIVAYGRIAIAPF